MIVGIALTVLAGAAAVGIQATWSYRPLSFYGSESGTAVWLPNGTWDSHENLSGPTIGQVEASTVWNAPSTWFTAGLIVAVYNQGRYGVTVDHLGVLSGATHDQASLQPLSGALWSGGTKFHPFHLAPHHEQLVTLTYRVRCMIIGPGGYGTTSALPVEYQFLGVHHTAMITLVEPLIFKGPADCPAT